MARSGTQLAYQFIAVHGGSVVKTAWARVLHWQDDLLSRLLGHKFCIGRMMMARRRMTMARRRTIFERRQLMPCPLSKLFGLALAGR